MSARLRLSFSSVGRLPAAFPCMRMGGLMRAIRRRAKAAVARVGMRWGRCGRWVMMA